MSKHPVGVTVGAYNTRVMTMNIPVGPEKARLLRGEGPYAPYAFPMGFSAGKLPTGHNY